MSMFKYCLGSVYCYNTIGPIISRNNTLQQLSLCDNRLDSATGRYLLQIYKQSATLLELGLTRDEIGSEVWEEFIIAYNLKKNLIAFTDTSTRSLNAAGLNLSTIEDDNPTVLTDENFKLAETTISGKLNEFVDGYYKLYNEED